MNQCGDFLKSSGVKVTVFDNNARAAHVEVKAELEVLAGDRTALQLADIQPAGGEFGDEAVEGAGTVAGGGYEGDLGKDFEFRFYFDVEASVHDPDTQTVLSQLEKEDMSRPSRLTTVFTAPMAAARGSTSSHSGITVCL